MSSFFVGFTMLLFILEVSAFIGMFWRSMDLEPYRR